MYPDHQRLKALVQPGEILDEVEKAIGSLEQRARQIYLLMLLLDVGIVVVKERRLCCAKIIESKAVYVTESYSDCLPLATALH